MAKIPSNWIDLGTIRLTDLQPAADVTGLNVTGGAPGLCPRLPVDITRFLRGDGTWAVPGGNVVTTRAVSAVTSAMGTSLIPTGNTAPAITEGTQYTPLQITHAMASAGNSLLFDLCVPAALQTTDTFVLALFDTVVPAAIGAAGFYVPSGYVASVPLRCRYSPGVTGTRTYVVRFGPAVRTSNTAFVCRTLSATDLWGNALAATMQLVEVSP